MKSISLIFAMILRLQDFNISSTETCPDALRDGICQSILCLFNLILRHDLVLLKSSPNNNILIKHFLIVEIKPLVSNIYEYVT